MIWPRRMSAACQSFDCSSWLVSGMDLSLKCPAGLESCRANTRLGVLPSCTPSVNRAPLLWKSLGRSIQRFTVYRRACAVPRPMRGASFRKLERCLNDLSPRRILHHHWRHLTIRRKLTSHRLKLDGGEIVPDTLIGRLQRAEVQRASTLTRIYIPVGSETFCKGLRTLGSDWVGFGPKKAFAAINGGKMAAFLPPRCLLIPFSNGDSGLLRRWCRGADSNHRHRHFQCRALPG